MSPRGAVETDNARLREKVWALMRENDKLRAEVSAEVAGLRLARPSRRKAPK